MAAPPATTARAAATEEAAVVLAQLAYGGPPPCSATPSQQAPQGSVASSAHVFLDASAIESAVLERATRQSEHFYAVSIHFCTG